MQAYIHTSLKKYLSNGEVIKYHKFISVLVIELSVGCLNTGPEDRLVRQRDEIASRGSWCVKGYDWFDVQGYWRAICAVP